MIEMIKFKVEKNFLSIRLKFKFNVKRKQTSTLIRTTKLHHHIKVSNFQSVIDRMLRNANTSFMLCTTSWREQFTDALTVHASMTYLTVIIT